MFAADRVGGAEGQKGEVCCFGENYAPSVWCELCAHATRTLARIGAVKCEILWRKPYDVRVVATMRCDARRGGYKKFSIFFHECFSFFFFIFFSVFFGSSPPPPVMRCVEAHLIVFLAHSSSVCFFRTGLTRCFASSLLHCSPLRRCSVLALSAHLRSTIGSMQRRDCGL